MTSTDKTQFPKRRRLRLANYDRNHPANFVANPTGRADSLTDNSCFAATNDENIFCHGTRRRAIHEFLLFVCVEKKKTRGSSAFADDDGVYGSDYETGPCEIPGSNSDMPP